MSHAQAPAAPLLPPDIRVFERGWLSSNNVLCLSDQTPALIDTGHSKHAAETVKLVQAELGEQPLARIAHTHLHSDHCGGSGALQATWPGARTWVPEPSLAHVQAWDEDALSFGGTGQRCDPFTATEPLVPGQTVRLGEYDWEIHAAPGHDALAVLLYEPRHGVLVAGDAMWENGVGVIFPHIDGSDGFDTFSDTLKLIERMNPAVVVPGHGAPFGRAGGAIDAAMARARQRIDYFNQHPAQHALYAAKVLIKYQMMDVERMPHAAFRAWLDAAPTLRLLHAQHRPDLGWNDWLAIVLAPLFGKEVLRQDGDAVLDGV